MSRETRQRSGKEKRYLEKEGMIPVQRRCIIVASFSSTSSTAALLSAHIPLS
jgi:hypothetical protein